MEYKWRALSVTSVGALMAAVDSTVVLLALLPITVDLGSDYVTVVWVVLAYLLATTAFVLSLGRMGDLYGRKRMYTIGFALFTVASVLCGLAPSAPLLVLFRALQGFGSALLFANSFAILSEAFPPSERGRAFGVNSIVWGVGSILGIILGGVLIAFGSWRWIFLINLPVGVVGTLWAYYALRETRLPPASARPLSFDIPGAGLFTGGIFALLLGVTEGLLYGWGSAGALGAFAATPVLFAGFVLWERFAARDPVIHAEFFRSRPFLFSIGAATLQSLALFAVNFLLLFYLQGLEGLPVLTASYLIVPLSVAIVLTGPVGGLLSDRFGPRVVATSGILVSFAALVALAELLRTGMPYWQLAALEAVFGLGGGLFWPANTSAIMTASPRGMFGVGSGIMNTFRTTGMVLSFAVALTAVTESVPAPVAFSLFVGSFSGSLPPSIAAAYLVGQRTALAISAALLLGAAALSALRSRPSAPLVAEIAPPAPAGGPAR